MTELPRLYEECESSRVRFPFAFDERVSGGEMRGPSFNEVSLDARRNTVAVLASWSGMVVEERGLAGTPHREVPDLAAFLVRHLDWLLAHPAAPYFADEVVTMTATARCACRVYSAPQLALGQCVAEDCGATLFATKNAGDARSSVRVRCEAGHTWRSHEWLALASQLNQPRRQPGMHVDTDARRSGT